MIPPELQELGVLIDEQEAWQACRQIDGTWLFDWSNEEGDGDEIVVVNRPIEKAEKPAPELLAAGAPDR